MSMLVPRDATIRSATCADAQALSQLMAAVGADNLPATGPEIGALLKHGHLLVLDLEAGMLGAAAHVVVIQTGRERHAVFRYLAVHPELAGSGVEHRMAAAMLELCDRIDGRGIGTAPTFAQRREAARRFAGMTMLLFVVPRMIASMGCDDAVAMMMVISALALISALRAPEILRIPRAIVRRRRAAGLRAWRDAVLIRLGEIPVSPCGHRMLPPPWLTSNAHVGPPPRDAPDQTVS